MESIKVVIFSGPAGVGKDTAIEMMSEALLKEVVEVKRAECKEHLFKLTKIFFNLTDSYFNELYFNRTKKEIPYIPLKNAEATRLYELLGYNTSLWGNAIDDKNRVRPYETTGYSLISIREAMIYISELVYKPARGQDIFGRIRASKVIPNDDTLYVDGSYGFVDELMPLINSVGAERILAIRLHCEGMSFDGDSRSYIPDGLVPTVDITTERGELEKLNSDLLTVLKQYKILID